MCAGHVKVNVSKTGTRPPSVCCLFAFAFASLSEVGELLPSRALDTSLANGHGLPPLFPGPPKSQLPSSTCVAQSESAVRRRFFCCCTCCHTCLLLSLTRRSLFTHSLAPLPPSLLLSAFWAVHHTCRQTYLRECVPTCIHLHNSTTCTYHRSLLVHSTFPTRRPPHAQPFAAHGLERAHAFLSSLSPPSSLLPQRLLSLTTALSLSPLQRRTTWPTRRPPTIRPDGCPIMSRPSTCTACLSVAPVE